MQRYSSQQSSRDRAQWVARVQGLREFLPDIVFLILSAYLWYEASQFREVQPGELGPDFWPQLLIALIAVTACFRIVQKVLVIIRRRRNERPATPAPTLVQDPDSIEEAVQEEDPIFLNKVAVVVALSIGYALGVVYLGYPLASALFLAIFLQLAGKRNWLINALVGVVGAFIFSYTFQKIVFISLPTGVGIFDTFTVWLYRLVGIY